MEKKKTSKLQSLVSYTDTVLPANSPFLTQWLSAKESQRTLRDVARNWFSNPAKAGPNALHLIQQEIWIAQMGAHSYPNVAVIRNNDLDINGVLSGLSDYGNRYFYIQHLAFHPKLLQHSEAWLDTAQRLVEAGIDYSLEMGCYGWVACANDERDRDGTQNMTFWKDMGFSRHDELTYRRMGYFS